MTAQMRISAARTNRTYCTTVGSIETYLSRRRAKRVRLAFPAVSMYEIEEIANSHVFSIYNPEHHTLSLPNLSNSVNFFRFDEDLWVTKKQKRTEDGFPAPAAVGRGREGSAPDRLKEGNLRGESRGRESYLVLNICSNKVNDTTRQADCQEFFRTNFLNISGNFSVWFPAAPPHPFLLV